MVVTTAHSDGLDDGSDIAPLNLTNELTVIKRTCRHVSR
ncbi:hypothetical protein Rruber_05403 (plasmid) [Rhodococcus ruber]